MKGQAPVEFNKLVVLYNPSSTNAAKAKKSIALLKQAYPNKVLVEKIPKKDGDTRALLKKHLKPDDILIPAGGDGTVNSVIDCLYHPDMPRKIRRVRVLPLGSGRMNDIARILNGRHYASPLQVIARGRELPVYPILCVCTPLKGGEPLSITSINHLGFGLSGEATKLYNDPSFRAEQRKLAPIAREIELLKASSEIIRDAPYFEITLKGKKRSILDLTLVNGHIFAGFYRVPVRLSSKEFFYESSTDKSFLRTARTVVELMSNRYSDGKTSDELSFTLHKPVPAHSGGELFYPPAPCQIRITLHKQPVTMLATSSKA